MFISLIFFLLQLQITVSLNGARVKRSTCGTLHGCWSVPNGCTNNGCTASARWSVSGRGSLLRLRLEALLRDLPTYAMYVALGFSKDRHMGDDAVLECIYNGIDEGRAYFSYNDGTYNTQLHEATAILIVNSTFAINKNAFICMISVDFKQLYRLSFEDKSRLYNLLTQSHYLQFARGSLDQYTYVKKGHSLSDGSLYPWTTTSMISLLRDKNGKYENVENAEQTKWFSRSTTYAMMTLHVILMIWSWWFLLSNAILISRHFKTFWPKAQIDHIPLWFQLHRGFALISIMIQTVAIILVIVQSRFQLYLWCTRQCTIKHFMKPLHTWAGLITYTLTVIQITVALFRPKWESVKRFYFNWFHRIVASAAFVAASLGIFAAITLDKTDLTRHYGKWPVLVVGLYLFTFIASLIGFTFLDAYCARRVIKEAVTNEDENAVISVKGDMSEVANEEEHPKFCWIRIIRLSMLIMHAVISFIVCFIITAMALISYARKH